METPIVDIAVLNLKPKSILVARVSVDYSLQEQQELCDLLERALRAEGFDNSILVLPEVTELSVIDEEQIEGTGD